MRGNGVSVIKAVGAASSCRPPRCCKLATLRDRELASVGKALQDQAGHTYRPLHDGERASGVYCRRPQLACGRFAMLDDGVGFSLVPWRPLIEPRLLQHMSVALRGQSVTWEMRKQRGISIMNDQVLIRMPGGIDPPVRISILVMLSDGP